MHVLGMLCMQCDGQHVMPCNKSVITSITWCITCSLINYTGMLNYMLKLHAPLHAHYMLNSPLHANYMLNYMLNYMPLHDQLHASLHAITSSTIPLHVLLHDIHMLNYMIHYILNYPPLHALHGMRFPFQRLLPQPRSPLP